MNENAIFLKTIGDARRIRYVIGSNLEAVSVLPDRMVTSKLHFE